MLHNFVSGFRIVTDWRFRRENSFAAALTLAIPEDSTDYFDSCKSFACGPHSTSDGSKIGRIYLVDQIVILK